MSNLAFSKPSLQMEGDLCSPFNASSVERRGVEEVIGKETKEKRRWRRDKDFKRKVEAKKSGNNLKDGHWPLGYVLGGLGMGDGRQEH